MKLLTSPEINNIAKALIKAQSQIKGAKADSENPYFKSKYADLASVLDACKKPLNDNGIAVLQPPVASETSNYVTTVLLHESGQWIAGSMLVTPKTNDPQAVGSAVSYARRYSLSSMIGITQEDDDATAAMETKPKVQEVTTVVAYTQINTPPAKSYDPGEYMIPFGKKFKGRKIKECALEDLESYVTWIEDDAKRTGKGLSNMAKDFISNVEAYEESFKNNKLHQAAENMDSEPPSMDLPF